MTTPLDALRSLHRSLEAGRSGEELRPHWHPSAKIREYPNTIAPQGALRDLDDTLAASERGAGLLASQTYEEVESFELADRAIMRLTWTGVVGAAAGGNPRYLVGRRRLFVRSHGPDRLRGGAPPGRCRSGR